MVTINGTPIRTDIDSRSSIHVSDVYCQDCLLPSIILRMIIFIPAISAARLNYASFYKYMTIHFVIHKVFCQVVSIFLHNPRSNFLETEQFSSKNSLNTECQYVGNVLIFWRKYHVFSIDVPHINAFSIICEHHVCTRVRYLYDNWQVFLHSLGNYHSQFL